MKIIIDTNKDSIEDIKKAISFLQGFTDNSDSTPIDKKTMHFIDKHIKNEIILNKKNDKKQLNIEQKDSLLNDEDLEIKVY